MRKYDVDRSVLISIAGKLSLARVSMKKTLAGARENHLADPIDVVGAGEDGDAAEAMASENVIKRVTSDAPEPLVAAAVAVAAL